MASTSPLCPADRLVRRSDLVVRRIPEIRMCMVYRPRPARVITLNPASWLLFEACNGGTVAEIEAAVLRARGDGGQAGSAAGVMAGLQQLLDLSLIAACHAPETVDHQGATNERRRTVPHRPACLDE
jgi:hypothetical protein